MVLSAAHCWYNSSSGTGAAAGLWVPAFDREPHFCSTCCSLMQTLLA